MAKSNSAYSVALREACRRYADKIPPPPVPIHSCGSLSRPISGIAFKRGRAGLWYYVVSTRTGTRTAQLTGIRCSAQAAIGRIFPGARTAHRTQSCSRSRASAIRTRSWHRRPRKLRLCSARWSVRPPVNSRRCVVHRRQRVTALIHIPGKKGLRYTGEASQTRSRERRGR